jgi:hypothetical protein
MATKKPAQKQHKWEITLIRERGKFLGYVEATKGPRLKRRSRFSRSRNPGSRSD